MNVSRISLAFKALRELGPRQLGLFAWYRVGLKTGFFRWRTPNRTSLTPDQFQKSAFNRHLLDLPDPASILKIIGLEGLSQLKAEADEIVEGRVRLFGGVPVLLNLSPPGAQFHWTDYALGKSAFPGPECPNFPIPDIKFIWEPARFGWAFSLGRAYHLTGDERYSAAFWRYYDMFRDANPVNLGPNWESAQEVALRLIAFTFAAHVFSDSIHSSADRQSQIALSIAEHAARIPPTLIYACAQNNNHLLSEAAGLITAAQALPEHPESRRWSKLGWKWFNRALESQIAEDGSYMQHSTNYHRLMLQLSLWVFQLQNEPSAIEQLSERAVHKLQMATQWLLNLLDQESGRVPNLGPNDGAYILPLTNLPFADYRPVLQAAARALWGEPVLRAGFWDEMAAWLCTGIKGQGSRQLTKNLSTSTLHASHSWAYLRAATFHDRPGHIDQLHLDLWWRGLNIAQDAGTYLYNADPPWDNSFVHTEIHNTVLVDGCEQMTRVGRFLYLDWAQAEVLKRERAADGSWERIAASHNGYQRYGLKHTRSVTSYQGDRWLIEDHIRALRSDMLEAAHTVRLNWLLPDWEWKIDPARLTIEILSPNGWITLLASEGIESSISQLHFSLFCAGELLYGSGDVSPNWGWVSPTYGVKEPALSFVVTAVGALPIRLVSKWNFPEVK